MQFDLEIGGRVRTVRLSKDGERTEVRVDDRTFAVDARRVGRDTLSLLVREGDGAIRGVDVTVAPRGGNGGLDIALDGRTLTATLVSRFGRRAGEGGAAGSGPQQLTAPMPGKVVRVLVAPGDDVQPRQGLIVIEAMKMENELRATRPGRVKAVRVAEGQSVEAGALLVTVE
ncbi:MAG: acetyl-CoA carboxylase biotin carboxyl carrier protein subunit [Acidobacteria bacterium]|nr:acetyl-CoA carboxylase biotin carboxyl carrier protein subunit [Acidobacteriota bacterium]